MKIKLFAASIAFVLFTMASINMSAKVYSLAQPTLYANHSISL